MKHYSNETLNPGIELNKGQFPRDVFYIFVFVTCWVLPKRKVML